MLYVSHHETYYLVTALETQNILTIQQLKLARISKARMEEINDTIPKYQLYCKFYGTHSCPTLMTNYCFYPDWLATIQSQYFIVCRINKPKQMFNKTGSAFLLICSYSLIKNVFTQLLFYPFFYIALYMFLSLHELVGI